MISTISNLLLARFPQFKRIFAYHETNSQSLIQERSTICVHLDQTWMIRKRRLKLRKWT